MRAVRKQSPDNDAVFLALSATLMMLLLSGAALVAWVLVLL